MPLRQECLPMDDLTRFLTDDDRDLVARLPRERSASADREDQMVALLRQHGYFRPRHPRGLIGAAVAAAVLVFLSGTLFGQWRAEQRSLEFALERNDLSDADRVLVLQRAGSAYVRASEQLAGVASSSPTARDVAVHILAGAAQAAARANLGG